MSKKYELLFVSDLNGIAGHWNGGIFEDHFILIEKNGIKHMFGVCPAEGCKSAFSLREDGREGYRHKIHLIERGIFTVTPSLLIRPGCGHHFFIEENKIRWA